MPKISIIIPVYNAEKYLPHCLDSILSQTFNDYEVICVNDGSNDNSLNILHEYTQKDKRITVIDQENQGCGYSRNNGYEKAKGDYIYFMDSDDAIHPQFLEVMHYFASTYNADLVCCGMEDKPEKYSKEKYSPDSLEFIFTYNPLYYTAKRSKYKINYNVGVKLFKRELLSDIKFIKGNFEDFSQACRVFAKKPKTILIKEKLYFYSVIDNSISHAKPKLKNIYDYYGNINLVSKLYNAPEYRQELKYIKQRIIPDVLKPQLGFCKKSDKDIKAKMYKTFANELKDLYNRGLITLRGNRLKKYLIYRYLIAFKAD